MSIIQLQVLSTVECCRSIASCEGDIEKFCTQVTKFLKLLSPNIPDLTKELLEAVFLHGGHMVVALDKDGSVVGMGTLILKYKLSGVTACVEDVIVDESLRGKGVGGQIMDALVELALCHQVPHVELTSNPARIAANKLYGSLGFIVLPTNVRRLVLRT